MLRCLHPEMATKGVLYRQLAPILGEGSQPLVRQRETQIEEGHLMPDHVLCAC